MAETSNYECAAEIADAIRRVSDGLAADLAGELASQLSGSLCRSLWAGLLFAEAVRQLGFDSIDGGSPAKLASVARRVWSLVDALDQGKARPGQTSSPAPAAPGDEGIDLGEGPGDLPGLDDIYGPGKS